MLIRYGYELTFNCPQPTMMVCLLDAHRERSQELRYEIPPSTIPAIPTTTYLDTFGNTVRRFIAPPGDLTITSDAVIEDSGLPDPIELDAGESPVEQLPNETLVFLLGSRYCETDKLADIAWRHFGSSPRGWRRVQAICDFVCGHLTFGYNYARATRTAFESYQERIGVCRHFAHLAVVFCRCVNIPARYANGFLGDIGVPPDPAPSLLSTPPSSVPRISTTSATTSPRPRRVRCRRTWSPKPNTASTRPDHGQCSAGLESVRKVR